MNTQWIVRTQGDPLQATRRFLEALWTRAGLEAMFVPVCDPGGFRVTARLVDQPAALAEADPFAPVLARNGASEAARLARAGTGKPCAAVLHACEVRALGELIKREPLVPGRLLVIGVDCLATFPVEEFEQRAQAAGGADAVTREALKFARQGGILLYRDRPACQMCASPAPEATDLCLGLLGLPANELILVSARDTQTAERLHLAEITDGEAPQSVVGDRQSMCAALADRRERTRQRMVETLTGMPATVQELVAHLTACEPCEECLKACAVYAGELSVPGQTEAELIQHVSHWIVACAGCGMCEQACPRHLPLAAIIGQISRELARSASGSPVPAWT